MITDEKRDQMLANSPSPKRITPDDIKAKVAKEDYSRVGDVTTVCVLTLQNGFTVVGKSACADPANYNQELGQKIAYDDAFRQIWALEGYLLKEAIFQSISKAA